MEIPARENGFTATAADMKIIAEAGLSAPYNVGGTFPDQPGSGVVTWPTWRPLRRAPVFA
jgi:hypothetical protein